MNQELKDKIFSMYENGAKISEIVCETGVSTRTIYSELEKRKSVKRNKSLYFDISCPYFDGDYKKQINCRIDDDIVYYSLHFKTAEEKKNHRAEFCQKKYKNCKFYHLHEEQT